MRKSLKSTWHYIYYSSNGVISIVNWLRSFNFPKNFHLHYMAQANEQFLNFLEGPKLINNFIKKSCPCYSIHSKCFKYW